MSYIINNSRGQIVAVVADGTTNSTATDLTLVGRAVTNFGEFQNENYVFLLENFANSTAPTAPVLGQLWYNAGTDEISTYSSLNTWSALASQDYVQAQKISPVFTGIPTAPTAPASTANTQLATTAFVTNSVQLAGVPTAPTATVATNTTQLATTAFVQDNKVSPAFSGVPTAPTAANGTSSTQIATTAFVVNSLAADLGTISLQNANAVTITGGTISGITDLAVVDGGTGASTVSDARVNLGLGTIATQNTSSINITGGTITGITALALADGGTGASTAVGARTNLGLASGATTTVGTMAVQNSNLVTITGGTITGIVSLELTTCRTGDSTAAQARTNLSVPPNSRTITAGTGLSGGGDLSADRTFTIATNSNGYGVRTVSVADPSGGNDGDIWYQI